MNHKTVRRGAGGVAEDWRFAAAPPVLLKFASSTLSSFVFGVWILEVVQRKIGDLQLHASSVPCCRILLLLLLLYSRYRS